MHHMHRCASADVIRLSGPLLDLGVQHLELHGCEVFAQRLGLGFHALHRGQYF